MQNAQFHLDKNNPTRSILTQAELEYIGEMLHAVRHVPGDVLELGSYMGGTALFLAERADGKTVFGCDTFDGFPVDDTHGNYRAGDFKCWETPNVYDVLKQKETEHLKFLKGTFEQTLPTLSSRHFSLVFFDCDIYPSLVTGHEFVKDRLLPGSRLLFHDYGYRECPGVEPFVDAIIRPNYKFVGQAGTNLLAFEK